MLNASFLFEAISLKFLEFREKVHTNTQEYLEHQ